MSRYECSDEAASMWGRLLSAWARKRDNLCRDRLGNMVNLGADAQRRGINWAERAEARGSLGGDLGTDSRLLCCDSERALELLAVMGPRQAIGAALARRRLTGHGTNQEERRYDLDREERDKLLEGAKEFLSWSLREDAELEIPDLPFP